MSFDLRTSLARFQAEWSPVSRPESAPTLKSRARSDAKPASTFAERALWLKPERRTARLKRRPDEALPFVSERPSGGLELLLDTCVYIDILQDRIPERVMRLFSVRLSNHSAIALAELTHLFGRLDPRDSRTKSALDKVAGAISNVPKHRLSAPSLKVLGEAGILAGLTARLSTIESGREQALLNDATLYLQAVENGQMVLTRNISEFDWFDQLFPCDRLLLYQQI